MRVNVIYSLYSLRLDLGGRQQQVHLQPAARRALRPQATVLQGNGTARDAQAEAEAAITGARTV